MIQKSVFGFAIIPAFEPDCIAPVITQALLRRRLRLIQIQGDSFAKIPIFESRSVYHGKEQVPGEPTVPVEVSNWPIFVLLSDPAVLLNAPPVCENL